MTRILAIAGAALVAISFEARPAEACEGPWRAVLNFGMTSRSTASIARLKECLPAVAAGFRGFSNHNPRWQPAEPQELRRKRAACPQQ
jgi:hypothetical protein